MPATGTSGHHSHQTAQRVCWSALPAFLLLLALLAAAPTQHSNTDWPTGKQAHGGFSTAQLLLRSQEFLPVAPRDAEPQSTGPGDTPAVLLLASRQAGSTLLQLHYNTRNNTSPFPAHARPAAPRAPPAFLPQT